MTYYNHVEQMKDFIKEQQAKGKNTFTHKDIQRVTNANCPYSVLKSLKKYYEISYEDKVKETIKKDLKGNDIKVNIKFREYTILKERVNNINVKKSNIWGTSETYQLPLVFLGEGIS